MITLSGTMIYFIPKSKYELDERELISSSKAQIQILVKVTNEKGKKDNKIFTVPIPDEKIDFYKDKISEDISIEVGIVSNRFRFFYI